MIPIKCIECVHCLPKTYGFGYYYYPRDCGEGMTCNADVFCSKFFPEFKDKSKSCVVDRSSRSIVVNVESSQLSLF